VLYKLKQADKGKTTFVPFMPTSMAQRGLPEKAMEQWLADNPEAVQPEGQHILVISQEHPFEPIVDILAVDPQGNLVVIEIKRGQTPRDVVAQALEYASEVASWDYQRLNQRAVSYFQARDLPYESLLGGFQDFFQMAPGDFNEGDFKGVPSRNGNFCTLSSRKLQGTGGPHSCAWQSPSGDIFRGATGGHSICRRRPI